jgi:hypothetical protein
MEPATVFDLPRLSFAHLALTALLGAPCVACGSANVAIHTEVPAPLPPSGTAVRVMSYDRDACLDADLHSV